MDRIRAKENEFREIQKNQLTRDNILLETVIDIFHPFF
jgi:hypothetical protein